MGIVNAFKDYEMQKRALTLEENILLAKENVMIALERFRLSFLIYLEPRETKKRWKMLTTVCWQPVIIPSWQKFSCCS